LVTITSTDNPRIKAIAKLKTARERKRTGLFLIEGHREVQRAITAGVVIETLILCAEILGDTEIDTTGCDTLDVSPAPMRRIAMRENPPGVVAVARQFETGLGELRLDDTSLLLIAESIEKPGNVGAMIRTCDGAGAGLIVADAATDLFNPNVVRASQGSLFTVPIAAAGAEQVIDWLGANDVMVVGGYPDAGRDLWAVDMTGPTAVLVGAEDAGISSTWDGVAEPVRIPMAGMADSLNASVSAALLLYEAIRQRRATL
jgi:TrmH family RNA methyltransferase